MLIIWIIINGLSFWGFHAHKIINRHAVYSLPDEMFPFYKRHIEYLEESSVNPDIRKHSDKEEAKRHYIDLEYYNDWGPLDSLMYLPLDTIKGSIDAKSLHDWGILPWSLKICYLSLVKSFRERNYQLILRYSSDLGHYVADAHVPLHTTRNYNGQLSGQDGIHALWESQIPEKYSKVYLLYTRKARYIPDVPSRIVEIILQSHQKAASLLENDLKIRAQFNESEIYQTEQKGNYFLKRYSSAYVERFNDQEGRYIEIQMKEAISSLGDFWITAWIEAGQPNLDKLKIKQKKAGNNSRKTTKIIEISDEREHN